MLRSSTKSRRKCRRKRGRIWTFPRPHQRLNCISCTSGIMLRLFVFGFTDLLLAAEPRSCCIQADCCRKRGPISWSRRDGRACKSLRVRRSSQSIPGKPSSQNDWPLHHQVVHKRLKVAQNGTMYCLLGLCPRSCTPQSVEAVPFVLQHWRDARFIIAGAGQGCRCACTMYNLVSCLEDEGGRMSAPYCWAGIGAGEPQS